MDLRRETEPCEAADLEAGPADLPGQYGAFLDVTFTVFNGVPGELAEGQLRNPLIAGAYGTTVSAAFSIAD